MSAPARPSLALAALAVAVAAAWWPQGRERPDAPLPPCAVVRIGRARFAGVHERSEFAWTPDGRRIVAACGAWVRVFDARTGGVVREFHAGTPPNPTTLRERVVAWFRSPPRGTWLDLRDIAVSHDGRRVAVASAGHVRLFDLGSGTEIGRWALDVGFRGSLVFSADDGAVYAATRAGLHRRTLSTGEKASLRGLGSCHAVAFAGGRLFAILGAGLAELDPAPPDRRSRERS